MERPGFKFSRPVLYDASGSEIDPFDLQFFDLASFYAPDGELGRECLAPHFLWTDPSVRLLTTCGTSISATGTIHTAPTANGGRRRLGKYHSATAHLVIAHYGSAIYAVIVLNGPFRGQIWVHDPNLAEYIPASMRTDLHNSTIKTENAHRLHQNSFSFGD